MSYCFYEQTDELSEQVLLSEGLIGTPLEQLETSEKNVNITELLSNADSKAIGENSVEGVPELIDIFGTNLETVTNAKLKQAKEIIMQSDELSDDIYTWLKDHVGSNIFVVYM